MRTLYRPRGSVIQARFLEESTINGTAAWCGGRVGTEAKLKPDAAFDETVAIEKVLVVPTLDGTIKVQMGRYLVRNELGQFYSLSKEDFEARWTHVFNTNGEPIVPKVFGV